MTTCTRLILPAVLLALLPSLQAVAQDEVPAEGKSMVKVSSQTLDSDMDDVEDVRRKGPPQEPKDALVLRFSQQPEVLPDPGRSAQNAPWRYGGWQALR